MITITRLNGKELTINADLIEFIESTPDTIISLTNKNKILVKETVDEVIDKIVTYKRRIHSYFPTDFGSKDAVLN